MNPQTVNNFKNFIFRNINKPSYDDSNYEKLNKWVKRALVWNAGDRVDFNISLAYFTKTVEGEVNPGFQVPRTREARSKTTAGVFGPTIYPKENTSTPFDGPAPQKPPKNFYKPFSKIVDTPFGKAPFKQANPEVNYQTKNPFFDQKDSKLKSHLSSRLNQRKLKMKSQVPVVNMKSFGGNNQYSYEVSPEDEALVNDLIDEINKGSEQVSLQDNLQIYNENKDNLVQDLTQSVEPETDVTDVILDDEFLDYDVKKFFNFFFKEEELDREIENIIAKPSSNDDPLSENIGGGINPTSYLPTPKLEHNSSSNDIDTTINNIIQNEHIKMNSQFKTRLSEEE